MTRHRVAHRHWLILLVLTIIAAEIFGQPASETALPFSLQSQSLLAPSAWRDGQNAAALGIAEIPVQGHVGLMLRQTDGALRRPQEAQRVSALNFFSEGAQRFGEWTTIGTLRYERRADIGLRWSNVNDAYFGTPFIWADSVGGDWQKDGVDISAAIGSPEFFNAVSAGVQVRYDVAQGARQSGARPLFRARNFHLSPAVMVRLVDSLRVGVSVGYLSRFEEGEFGAVGVDFPQLIYLRGLGTANTTTLNSAERRIVGDGIEFGAQAQGILSDWTWSAAAAVLTRQDSTQDLAFVPDLNRTAFRFAGRFDYRTLSLALAVQRVETEFGMEVQLHGTFIEGRGTDPIFLAVNTVDQTQTASASVAWWRGTSRLYAPLLLNIESSLATLWRRDILAETQWRRTMLSAQATLGTSQRFGELVVFIGRLTGGGATALFKSYEAFRPLDLTPVLVRPDFLAMAATRFWLSATLSFETPIAAFGNSVARLVVQGELVQSTARLDDGSALNARNRFNAGMELVF